MPTHKHIELIGQFFQLMESMHKSMWQKAPFSSDGGVTPLQMVALLYVMKNPHPTVGALGKHIQLSSSATAQLTDRLNASGFIKRTHHPNDRRMVLLAMTPKGEKALNSLFRKHQHTMRKFLKQMPERDLE